MHRRQVLALGGAGLTALAGCTAGRTDRAVPDTELSVELDALQPAAVELNVDYYRIASEPDTQYLFLDVAATSGPAPSLPDLAFRFDGEDHAPDDPAGEPVYRGYSVDYYGGGEEDGSGLVLFELPETGDASDAALVWPGGEWRPDERLRARLAAPSPVVVLEAWSVPETVPLDSSPTFEFRVRNEGDLAGRFVGGINGVWWGLHRPVTPVSRRIPPGETSSWTVAGEEIRLVDDEFSDSVGDGEPDIDYELVWTDGDASRAVRVVEE